MRLLAVGLGAFWMGVLATILGAIVIEERQIERRRERRRAAHRRALDAEVDS